MKHQVLKLNIFFKYLDIFNRQAEEKLFTLVLAGKITLKQLFCLLWRLSLLPPAPDYELASCAQLTGTAYSELCVLQELQAKSINFSPQH